MRRIGWVGAAVVAASCSSAGTHVGNPDQDGELDVRFTSVSSRDGITVERPNALGVGLLVSDAWVVVHELALVPGESCPSEGPELEPLGEDLVVQIAGLAEPFLLEQKIAAGDYCEMELSVRGEEDPRKRDREPLGGASIVIEGATEDGTPFVFKSFGEHEAELESASGAPVHIRGGAFVFTFDVGKWLDGIDLAAATVTEGTILVDEGHNVELFRQFERQITLGLALYTDADGDGVPEPSDELQFETDDD